MCWVTDCANHSFTGQITYTPITSTAPASNYWGIDQTVTYGESGTTLMDNLAGIVDTGMCPPVYIEP